MVLEWGRVSEQPSGSLPDLFVAFDTETTGLSPVDDRVVEIAAIAFRPDGAQVGVFEQLVDPGIPIPPALTGIHGITDAMVSGKPRIEQVLPEFIRFVGSSVLIAHNAPYDIAMLMVPLRRMGAGRGAAVPLPGNRVLDTCSLARAAFPGAPNYRLSTIAGRLGIRIERAHRALSDVATCMELFLRILRQCGPGTTFDALLQLDGTELTFGAGEGLLARVRPGGRTARFAGVLREAVTGGRPISIEYEGGTRGNGPRIVTPMTLMVQRGMIYMVAQCHLDGSLKNFRLDRISAVRPPD